MSEAPIHAKSGLYVLIAVALLVIGATVIWLLQEPNPWEDAGYVDWSTNPDAVEEATGVRPKHYAPIIRGVVANGDTTYRIFPPEGMLADAKAGFILGLDARAEDGAKYYLPPELYGGIKDSLANGGIVRLMVLAIDSGIVFKLLGD